MSSPPTLCSTSIDSPPSTDVASYAHLFGKLVELNIGGEIFATTIGTLTRNGSDRNYFHSLFIAQAFEPVVDR
jgi:hypothetical protein